MTTAEDVQRVTKTSDPFFKIKRDKCGATDLHVEGVPLRTTHEDCGGMLRRESRYEVRLNHSPPLPAKTFEDLRVAKHHVRSHFDCGPLQVVPVSDTELRFFSTRGQLLATVVVK